jgi:nucleotide-binding universal stress UspA family protein
MNMLRDMTHPFRGRKASVDLHSQQGDPSVLVPAFVIKHRIDLLVMGTVARKGIRGFLTGNTAESIFQKVSCSLLAIKPEGFVSPFHIG